MARATDDERRLIEGRLRELAGRKGPYEIDCRLAEAVMGHDFCETPCDGCLSTVLARLADLIEPPCDREALLAIEENMFEDAVGLAMIAELEGSSELQDLQSTMAGALMDYARRIRAAIGMVDGG